MTIRATGAALAAITILALAAPATAQEPSRTISVSGEASTVVPNDVARFVFGVQTRRPTASAALRATSARIRRVIAGVTAQGVRARDVVTSTVSVTRLSRRVRPGSRRRVVEYSAINSVRVTVRNLPVAGRVVDAAVAGGATSVRGPSFSPGNVRDVYRRTLVAAFQDAREKAQRLAAEAGVTLGAPVSIREGGEPRPAVMIPPSPRLGTGRRRAAPTPIRAGTTRVRAQISAVFAIS